MKSSIKCKYSFDKDKNLISIYLKSDIVFFGRDMTIELDPSYVELARCLVALGWTPPKQDIPNRSAHS